VPPRQILLVDDDRNFLKVMAYQIGQFGFAVTPVDSAAQALQVLEAEPIDLVISDVRMPGTDGVDLLRTIVRTRPQLPVILLTAHGTIDKAVEAIKAGAHNFLTKPFEKEELRVSIANALKMSDLVRENETLSAAVHDRFSFAGLAGKSEQFATVLRQAEQLAGVETTVLIQGESGTGKELLAKAIHYNSARRTRPLVAVNCGAIPENLVEAELFGYTKGAFTGAIADRKGKFETANHGTVFLDEVGDLPLSVQVKLLRVLQDKQIDMVGSPLPRQVDVRIIAATHRNLRDMVKTGEFREDLFYRLSVAPLTIPPLRSRPEDIPPLVHHFLVKISTRLGKKATLSQAAFQQLLQYDWPGNVRELENVLERLVVFNVSGTIEKDDLPVEILSARTELSGLRVELPEHGVALEEVEKALLLAALERHGWNQSQAARYLGITRNTLIYRMQKYDLRPVGESQPPTRQGAAKGEK
jgi:DNA-binding NtrC family response regulator